MKHIFVLLSGVCIRRHSSRPSDGQISAHRLLLDKDNFYAKIHQAHNRQATVEFSFRKTREEKREEKKKIKPNPRSVSVEFSLSRCALEGVFAFGRRGTRLQMGDGRIQLYSARKKTECRRVVTTICILIVFVLSKFYLLLFVFQQLLSVYLSVCLSACLSVCLCVRCFNINLH